MSSTFGSGPQGGRQIYSPNYSTFKKSTLFTVDQLTDTANLEFSRVVGPQRIVFKYLTPALQFPQTWSFSLTGGNGSTTSPNVLYTGAQIENYVVGEPEPTGCTVETLPIPVYKQGVTSRINQFTVIESVTGDNFNFTLKFCPFLSINPTLLLTNPSGTPGSTLQVDVTYNRASSDQRGQLFSKSYSQYATKNFITLFTPVVGVNPLDDNLPHPFYRFNGQQTMIVRIGTTFYFSIEFDFGVLRQGSALMGAGYLGYTDPTWNFKFINSENCTVLETGTVQQSMVKTITFTATTPAPDSRVYEFVFDGNVQLQRQPTIRLASGAAIGNEVVSVIISGLYFMTI